MTRTSCVVTLAILATTTLRPAAQTGGSASQPQIVTVTGCIERGVTQQMTSATTANTQVTGTDTKFVLTSVVAETKPTGTTGSNARGSVSDARSYRLDDTDESKVADHVGQTVEISGTVQPQSPTEASTSGSTAPTGSTATADTIAPKIKVDTIRVVAQGCSRK